MRRPKHVRLICLTILAFSLIFPVSAVTILSDDFERLELGPNWTVVKGNWQIESGELSAEGAEGLLASGRFLTDFSVEVKVKIIDDGGNPWAWVGILARAANPYDDCWTSGYLVYLRHNGRIELYTYADDVIAAAQTDVTPDDFVTITAHFAGSNIQVFVNGVRYINVDHGRYAAGYFSLKNQVVHGHFDDVIVDVPSIPLKWGVVVMGGYNYYRDLRYNAIQRIEKIMQGRGVPYDVIQDNELVAPADNPPAGTYSLQYANGTLKYQVLVLLFDYEPTDNTGVNLNYIYWAVDNGTNAVILNKAARAVPGLLGLTLSDVTWIWTGLMTNNTVYRTFNDGIKEYTSGSNISLGFYLYYHTVIHNSAGMTVWFNKTWSNNWSIGMANTTYGRGKVWYLGYSLNEFSMEYSVLRYPTSWSDWKMEFWAHAINFALNSAEKIGVGILPYKQWKGAWVNRVDSDTPFWRSDFLPPESILQTGWVYDYQYCVLGWSRITGTADLPLTSGAPSGYAGIPSNKVMHTDVTGVYQTDLRHSKTYAAIIYNSTADGPYDRIRLDFDENMNFADDTEYRMWENMTYTTVQGKLYWSRIFPDSSAPTLINVAWWQTPMLMQNEAFDLEKWQQYGAEYGLDYSFHGWQHVAMDPGGSSYGMWNGTHFLLNATYIEEKYNVSRYWMTEKFGGTGYGFEENQVVISHPYNSHPSVVDQVIDDLPWVLLQYDAPEPYVGFGLKSATSKYTLSSANEEFYNDSSRFAVLEDMIKTLYPVVSTFAHAVRYNTTYSFQPYSNSLKPATARDAFEFWINAKSMLENTRTAFYQDGIIILEFNASSELTDYVWRFPVQYRGAQFRSISDNRSIGMVKQMDADYVYVEFSQGQGPQRLVVTYGTAAPTVSVTVSNVSPLGSGTTNPPVATYTLLENSLFSITATPLSGYALDHWELDGVNAGSTNPYSFNVSTSNHTVTAFFSDTTLLHNCDSLEDWIPSSSVLSIDSSDFQQGTGSLVVAPMATPLWHIYAILQKPMNLTGYPSLRFWVKPSDATKTLRLMVANDWNNYNIYTVTELTSNTWAQALVDLSTPTSTTGTVDLNSIAFIRFDYEIQYTSASLKIDYVAKIKATTTVSVTVNEASPLGSGTTNPAAGYYAVNETKLFSINAIPASGYTFDHWELDGAPAGTNPSYTFNVGTSDHNITAFFRDAALLDSCDSLENWVPRFSELSIDEVDFQEGTGALTIANTTTPAWHIYAILQKPMNLSGYTALRMWIKPSDATRTLTLMVATDWSNYNTYAITGLTSNAWTLITLNLSTPTSAIGTVDFNSVSFFRFDYELQSTSGSVKIDEMRGAYPWVGMQAIPIPRSDATAAVYNGKIYVFGGYYQGTADVRNDTYEYNPSSNTWTQKADMPTARWGPIAVEYNGLIYVFSGSVNVNEVYNPATDTWTTRSTPPSGFNQGLMAARYGDRIHLFYVGMHYEYDPATDTYTARAQMPTSRAWATCAVVGNRIYLIGGHNSVLGAVNVTEAYDPATNTWTTMAPMPFSKYGGPRESPVINGKIYVTHGRSGTGTTGDFYVNNYAYDPATDSWQEMSPAIYARAGPACAVVNQKLYVIGGVASWQGGGTPTGLNYNEEYDPSIDP